MINYVFMHTQWHGGMTTGIGSVSAKAIGQLLINCIAAIRKECDSIAKETGITR